ncbi:protein kinase [Streptomyces sp. NPDC059460]|uniref:protein kinase domain-containing protein n=1 Tax=Streptomyces sp. NPDC059460 TaxID=3346840 RepID=UPI0036B4A421
MPAHALWLLLREAAVGLASVHVLDVVHRDLKSSNVMLTLDGLTLIDFGLARAAEQNRLTRTGMAVGTPAYMAPEQASDSRRLSGATDVFALGSVLAYAACGRPPFGKEPRHGVLYRIVHEEPGLEPLRELEPDLAGVVAACLDKDPEGRPTAAELLDRAPQHGPFTAPLWPAAITERLSERAAFAAKVQEIDVPMVPLTGGKPEPEGDPQPEPKPEAESRPERPERPERRRTRILLAVVPVVVVGGTALAIQHLPHTSSPQAEAQTTPSASVSAPADPTPSTAGGSPSGTASPAKSPAKARMAGGTAGLSAMTGPPGRRPRCRLTAAARAYRPGARCRC